MNWPYDILSFSFNILSWSSITVFLFYVSEKSSDAATDNESRTSSCHLYHKYDSVVPSDSIISGLHSWTLRSIKLLPVIKHGQETYLHAVNLLTGAWITTSRWQHQGIWGLLVERWLYYTLSLFLRYHFHDFLWPPKNWSIYFFHHDQRKICLGFSTGIIGF